MNTTLEKLKAEFAEHVHITPANLHERVMKVPALKHYWVAWRITAKKERYILLGDKMRIKKALIETEVGRSVVSLSKQTLDKIEDRDELHVVNKKLHDVEEIIDYLNDAVNIMTFLGNDVRNILELQRQQME